jgi:hypothetical protein
MSFPASCNLRDIYTTTMSHYFILLPDSCTHLNHLAGRDFGTSARGWFLGGKRPIGGTGGRLVDVQTSKTIYIPSWPPIPVYLFLRDGPSETTFILASTGMFASPSNGLLPSICLRGNVLIELLPRIGSLLWLHYSGFRPSCHKI